MAAVADQKEHQAAGRVTHRETRIHSARQIDHKTGIRPFLQSRKSGS